MNILDTLKRAIAVHIFRYDGAAYDLMQDTLAKYRAGEFLVSAACYETIKLSCDAYSIELYAYKHDQYTFVKVQSKCGAYSTFRYPFKTLFDILAKDEANNASARAKTYAKVGIQRAIQITKGELKNG